MKQGNNDIELIKANIDTGREAIKGKVNDCEANAVLFLGNSGAGKTTLINYLISNKLKIIKQGFPPKKVLEAEKSIDSLKIGHKISSETTLPNIWSALKYQNKEIALWDCPRFGDNRGVVQDISNSYYLKMLFDQYKHRRIVMTILENSFEGRGENFLRLITSFTALFGDGSYKKGLHSNHEIYF